MENVSLFPRNLLFGKYFCTNYIWMLHKQAFGISISPCITLLCFNPHTTNTASPPTFFSPFSIIITLWACYTPHLVEGHKLHWFLQHSWPRSPLQEFVNTEMEYCWEWLHPRLLSSSADALDISDIHSKSAAEPFKFFPPLSLPYSLNETQNLKSKRSHFGLQRYRYDALAFLSLLRPSLDRRANFHTLLSSKFRIYVFTCIRKNQ